MSRSGGGRSLFAAATWQRAVQGVAGPTTSWVAAHQPPEVATPFLLAGAVGLAAGLGAVALTGAVEALTDLFFDRIGGGLIALGGSWMVIWIPLLGVAPVVFLIERFAREARGHGVPEVMFAIETRDGRIRPRVPLIKGVASALTIGVGGSVGREGADRVGGGGDGVDRGAADAPATGDDADAGGGGGRRRGWRRRSTRRSRGYSSPWK